MENLLKDLLKLETREEFKETNKGQQRELNLKLECDLAFIRSQFKRTLKSKQPKGLILTDSKNQNTKLCFANSHINTLDFSTLEDRNKVLKSINNWINSCKMEGVEPQKIAFI